MLVQWRKYGWIAIAVATVALGACSGDDGEDGADGESFIIGVLPASSATLLKINIDGVEVSSPPVVSFTATDGNDIPVAGLRVGSGGNLRFAIATLIPGTNGNPSYWKNYVVSGGGQATYERDGTLTDLGNGRYTYKFLKDITADPDFSRSRTHRVAMQIDGFAATNPSIDFRPDGGAVTVRREIVKTATCNSCHNQLAMHGGGRIEMKYCVTCHTPATIDPQSGNTVDFKVMIHKIHRGEELPSVVGGTPYQIIGFRNSVHDYSTVVFPQDIRNCTKCHDGADPDTPQGNNWKTRPSEEACGSCHDDIYFGAGPVDDRTVEHPGGATSNAFCVNCHVSGGRNEWKVESAHFLAEPVEREKFKLNILKICGVEVGTNPGPLCAPGVKPSVTYSITDPTNGEARYDIAEPEIDGGNLSFLVAWDTRDYNNTDGNGTRPARADSFSAITGAIEGVMDAHIPYTGIVNAGPGSNATVVDERSTAVTPLEGLFSLEIDFQNTMGTDGAAKFEFGGEDISTSTTLHFAIDRFAVPTYADLVVQLEDGTATAPVFLSDYVPAMSGNWEIYDVPLADFTGLNLTNLTRIGFRSLSSTVGAPITLTFGKIYVDDVQILGATALAVFNERNLKRTYTVTAGSIIIPDGTGPTAYVASGSGTIGAQGRLVGDFDKDGKFGESASNNPVTGEQERIFVKSEVAFFRIDDPVVKPRRPTVDNAKCNQCHDQVSFHGGSRSGEYGVCILCHNPNNTDIARRPTNPADASDGKVEDAIDMKRMIHGIHAGAQTNYDDSEAHGFREKGLVLYGFGNREHDYSHVRFPGILNDCETCHEPGAYNLDGIWASPTANGILGSTVVSNVDSTPDDDLNISPTAAVCSSCHDGDVARAHMVNLGGAVFDQDQFSIDGSLETCSICHGPGHIADVEMVHARD